jgi:hypothetical protein
MEARHLTLTIGLVLLASCGIQPFPLAPAPEPVEQVCECSSLREDEGEHEEPELWLEADDEDEPAETWGSLSNLLIFRQQVCALPKPDRRQLLQEGGDDGSYPVAITRLMAASCVPEENPELLASAVADAWEQRESPPGFFAFLELLEAQLRSYSLLEERLRTTEQQLEEVIEGIRVIETEMGTETPNGPSDVSND